MRVNGVATRGLLSDRTIILRYTTVSLDAPSSN